jgi:hypothetical protein
MQKYSRIFENTSCFHNVFLFHVINLMWPKLLNADGGLWILTLSFSFGKKTNGFQQPGFISSNNTLIFFVVFIVI